ncbi:hypothetical protein J1P26_19925 [Neobacillus sp. MM2021_6]|uniref:hypothetical protein n=1 Tax=Bacillaceae TaxID=186817 RepID=UPI00140C9F69|nr:MULTISPECIES: hypothetical protein [Bacillaceae]MBO0961977.1 hypothetical protein [Neobacillus sp. MM2021_6]NHC20326.1 hypothetical protein [Bacillus sp. MM2020_4]
MEIRQTSTYRPYNRNNFEEKPPGKPVGEIEVVPFGYPKDKFNPFIVYLVVSPYRRDFNKIVDQINQQRKAKLPAYERDLFNSCFKNWNKGSE